MGVTMFGSQQDSVRMGATLKNTKEMPGTQGRMIACDRYLRPEFPVVLWQGICIIKKGIGGGGVSNDLIGGRYG